MTIEIPASQCRAEIPNIIKRVENTGEQVIVTRHGKPIAAFINIKDLELLEYIKQKLSK
jgi:prevent-host-death family protein